MFRQKLDSGAQPTVDDLTVAVHEEYIAKPCPDLEQPLKSLVPGARRRKGLAHVQFHDRVRECTSPLHGAVGRTGVDINHAGRLVTNRFQAANEPVTFVSADDDHAQLAARRGIWVAP